jgi:RNA polymerase sigma factor (sigma-70 family)
MKSTPKRSRHFLRELGNLYEAHGLELRIFLRNQLRVKHQVDDTLHDIFLSVLKYPPFGQLVDPKSYLFRIAWRRVNAANRGVKRDKERLTEATIRAGDWILGHSANLTPKDMAQWAAREEQAVRGLEKLTHEEHRAVHLARLGFSYEEAAERLNITLEELRKHLRQGYLKLKASVDGCEKE